MRDASAQVTSATARWDIVSDPNNPGWIVEVVHLTGDREIIRLPSRATNARETTEPSVVIALALKQARLTLAPPAA
jgi:hypothetical protein